MAGQFVNAGHELLEHPAGADLVILNSCTVTSAAAADSRQKVRQAVKAGARQVVITGCWATMDPAEASAIPGEIMIVNNDQKPDLVRWTIGDQSSRVLDLPIARHALPGIHRRTRAFIKAQEGCDNFCSYCITRVARGRSRSAPKELVLQYVQAAELGGAREVVLTGVHLGSWGLDLDPPTRLYDLVCMLLHESSIPRIRFSSLEPWDLDERFFSLWENKRICRHLHLPLQSGSASVLKRMKRRITPEKYAEFVHMARKVCPDMAVTTDIIVGFPGETETEFEDSLEYVRRMAFSGGHVFPYSPRVGTLAASYPGRVPKAVAKIRSRRMRNVLDVSAETYRRFFLGSIVSVLWESGKQKPDGNWVMTGLTDNYQKVLATSQEDLWNRFSLVRLDSIGGRFFTGTIIKDE